MSRTFIFQGVGGPLRFNSVGNISLARDGSLLREDIMDWLLTLINESFMEPDDGLGLDQFKFDPNDRDTHELISSFIRDKLNANDERVSVQDVFLRPDKEGRDLLILIVFQIATDQESTDIYSIEFSAEV